MSYKKVAQPKRTRASRKQSSELETAEALINNIKAIEEGPRKKQWSRHDLRHIHPLNPTQEEMFVDFMNGNHICAVGSAGTGKSFCALYLAFNQILAKDTPQDKIIIVRSAVPTRDVGFMPGTLEEKVSLYEQPYKDMCIELFGREKTYDDMKNAGVIRFVTTSFIRGLSWNNAVIIADEIQSMNFHEINTVITRCGHETKLILCGDHKQNDLLHKKTDQSGIGQLLRVLPHVADFSIVNFTKYDIVRGDFVKQWIIACESEGT